MPSQDWTQAQTIARPGLLAMSVRNCVISEGELCVVVAPASAKKTNDDPASRIAQNLQAIARVSFGGVGTRIFSTCCGSFDTHAMQANTHAARWRELAEAVAACLSPRLRSLPTLTDRRSVCAPPQP